MTRLGVDALVVVPREPRARCAVEGEDRKASRVAPLGEREDAPVPGRGDLGA